MGSEPKHERSERLRTDESLEQERSKTDDELAQHDAALEQDADAVVSRARERANEVLEKARAEADEKIQAAGAGVAAQNATQRERRTEDRALTNERATADAELADERDERRTALVALLQLEREQTDLHLSMERERIDEAIQSRDDFLGVASHDIRHLLGGMALSANLLLEIQAEGEIRSSIERQAKRLQRFTSSMSRLVSDLLDVVSMEAGRLALHLELHDARELIGEIIDRFQPLASAKGVALVTDLRSSSAVAHLDRERVLQVLANLVGNAVKFSATGAKVVIALDSVDRDLRFTVCDTGAGIPPDDVERVFERFWQGGKRQASLGLGLYIARGIVEAHAGRIWVDSVMGAGSTFYFTVPAAADAPG